MVGRVKIPTAPTYGGSPMLPTQPQQPSSRTVGPGVPSGPSVPGDYKPAPVPKAPTPKLPPISKGDPMNPWGDYPGGVRPQSVPTEPTGTPVPPAGGPEQPGGAGGGNTAIMGLSSAMALPPPLPGTQQPGYRQGLGQRQHPPLLSALAGLQRVY